MYNLKGEELNIKPNVFQGLFVFQCPVNLQTPLLVNEAGEESTSSNQAMQVPA